MVWFTFQIKLSASLQWCLPGTYRVCLGHGLLPLSPPLVFDLDLVKLGILTSTLKEAVKGRAGIACVCVFMPEVSEEMDWTLSSGSPASPDGFWGSECCAVVLLILIQQYSS